MRVVFDVARHVAAAMFIVIVGDHAVVEFQMAEFGAGHTANATLAADFKKGERTREEMTYQIADGPTKA